MQNSPDETSAGKMLETNIRIYIRKEKIYNETLQKPICRFPGSLMGFRKAENSKENLVVKRTIYTCEDCGFIFCRAGEIKECPYCGKKRIRSVTEEEDKQLRPFLERPDSDFGIHEE